MFGWPVACAIILPSSMLLDAPAFHRWRPWLQSHLSLGGLGWLNSAWHFRTEGKCLHVFLNQSLLVEGFRKGILFFKAGLFR